MLWKYGKINILGGVYILKLCNISKRFNGRKILNNINFEFDNNIYVISGQSGIGKTTLLNIIAGYLNVDTGEILKKDTSRIEYLFQEDLLFSNLTVKENMFIKYSSDNCVEKDTVITLFKNILSKLKIEHLLNEKISMLSGGEKQRVQLANILIRDPDIILMDEPISKLDGNSRKDVIDLISNIFSDKTVIMISHDDIVGDFIYLKIENGELIYE